MDLHPDKLVGVTRSVLNRPKRPRPSVEHAASSAVQKRASTALPKPARDKQPGQLIESLAFALHDNHRQGYFDRMARPLGGPATYGNRPKRRPEGRPTTTNT